MTVGLGNPFFVNDYMHIPNVIFNRLLNWPDLTCSRMAGIMDAQPLCIQH
jgi:hypothetical protein